MPSKQEVFEKIQAALVDALGVDEEEVTADATLVGDLVRNRSTFWISYFGWKRPSASRFRGPSCSRKTF